MLKQIHLDKYNVFGDTRFISPQPRSQNILHLARLQREDYVRLGYTECNRKGLRNVGNRVWS